MTTRPMVSAPAKVHFPAPRDVWQRLHESDLYAMPTQAPAWMDCITASGRYRDASRLYEMPDGRLAVLPMVSSVLPYPGAILHSMPSNWGYGGLVAPDGVDAELISSALDDLTTIPALRIHLRPNPIHGPLWAEAVTGRSGITSVPRNAHVIDLRAGFDRLWQDDFRSSTKRAVRRAESLGVTVETDISGRLVPVFYGLLVKSFDRWADQQHEPRWLARSRGRRRDPIENFYTMATHLGRDCQVSVAWFEDRPAAAAVVLRGGYNAHDTRGAMDKAVAAPSKANVLLQKVVVEAACRDGCVRYHMGESGNSAPLATYKTSFGARGHEYAEYWIERLPMSQVDRVIRSTVKKAIGFRDV